MNSSYWPQLPLLSGQYSEHILARLKLNLGDTADWLLCWDRSWGGSNSLNPWLGPQVCGQYLASRLGLDDLTLKDTEAAQTTCPSSGLWAAGAGCSSKSSCSWAPLGVTQAELPLGPQTISQIPLTPDAHSSLYPLAHAGLLPSASILFPSVSWSPIPQGLAGVPAFPGSLLWLAQPKESLWSIS